MGFSGDQTYQAPVEAVIALFVESNVVRARYEAAGDRDIEILECGPDGDGFVIRTSRTVDVDLPGFARRVLKPTNTLVQVDRWGPADAAGARERRLRDRGEGRAVEDPWHDARRSGRRRLPPHRAGQARRQGPGHRGQARGVGRRAEPAAPRRRVRVPPRSTGRLTPGRVRSCTGRCVSCGNRNPRVHLVDELGVLVVDDLALDLELRCQLARGDGEQSKRRTISSRHYAHRATTFQALTATGSSIASRAAPVKSSMRATVSGSGSPTECRAGPDFSYAAWLPLHTWTQPPRPVVRSRTRDAQDRD